MDSTSDACFGHMQGLLKEWLHGARLLERTAVVLLAKHELARRGISLTYSINQTDREPASTERIDSRG
jgi:hypothetical protein